MTSCKDISMLLLASPWGPGWGPGLFSELLLAPENTRAEGGMGTVNRPLQSLGMLG